MENILVSLCLIINIDTLKGSFEFEPAENIGLQQLSKWACISEIADCKIRTEITGGGQREEATLLVYSSVFSDRRRGVYLALPLSVKREDDVIKWHSMSNHLGAAQHNQNHHLKVYGLILRKSKVEFAFKINFDILMHSYNSPNIVRTYNKKYFAIKNYSSGTV